MTDLRRRVDCPPDGSYAMSRDVLPGAVASTVGYESSGVAGTLHRGLPSPYLTFIFSLGDPIVTGPSASEALSQGATQSDILVAGLHDAPTYVLQPGTQTGVQLAVHPLAARMVLGAPAARVPWQVTQGSDLLGREAERVRERLGASSTWPARFAILAEYLEARVAKADRFAAPRPELVAAWTWLSRRRGGGSMDDLARHVALSPRQLRTVFQAELGVGPKQVGRLMRFDAAKQEIARTLAIGGVLSLSDVAVQFGYYDHAHLDAEFREFAGTSPTGWVAEERRNIQAGGHRNGSE